MKTHKPRQLAKPGLSLVDANQGRLITYQDDVLKIKQRIMDKWPGLVEPVFDKVMECWVLIEHCEDGTDRLMFTTEALSQATIDRIDRADQTSRSHVDPNKAYEEMDKSEIREKDHTLSEKVGEAAERLYYGLRKDGIIDRPQVFFQDKS